MYLTGTLRQKVVQVPFLLGDIETCIYKERHSSPIQSYTNQFICIQTYLFHCLLRGNQISEVYSRTSSLKKSFSQYCGSIFVNDYKIRSSDTVLLVEIIKGHILYNKILKFNFRVSKALSCRDHGLLFYNDGFKSERYCGKRVPWTLIMPSDKSYIRLVIKSYLKYELSIFFSSFKIMWIKRFSYVKLLHLGSNDLKFTEKNINSAQCYILVGNINFIHLIVLSTGPLSGSVTVHDGPGRLSNTILQLDNTISPINDKASTTAYWAFVDVVLPQTTDTVVKIMAQTDSLLRMSASCSRQGFIDIPETSVYPENIVCSVPFDSHDDRIILALYVIKYVFDAPSKLTDTSKSSCQYGGLIVFLYSTDQGFELCEDINYLEIGSQSNILYISLVWFHGYSRGSFIGYIENVMCRSYYLEHIYPDTIYKPDIFVAVEAYPFCYQVVCPPKHSEVQHSCTLQLGPPSVGSVDLRVVIADTLEPCDRDLRLTDEYIEEATSHTINASFIEHWPFGIMNSSRKSYLRYNMESVNHTYEFLHFAAVKSTIICSNKMPRKQMALFVISSQCKKLEINGKNMYSIANGIALLTDTCMKMVYVFLPTNKRINNRHNPEHYHDFIYKGHDHKLTTGHEVIIDYTACPAECRNFNYSVFVRSKDSTTIIEYTSAVGHGIFTGYYHRGFRVKLSVPDNACVFKQVCRMELTFVKPYYQIGTKHYGLGSLRFYKKR